MLDVFVDVSEYGFGFSLMQGILGWSELVGIG